MKVESRAVVGGAEFRRGSHAAGVALALVLALLLSGCGGGPPENTKNTRNTENTGGTGKAKSKDSTDSAGRSNDSSRSTPSPTPTASPSSAGTPSPTSTPTRTPTPASKSPRNGRNLDACRDLRCEVEAKADDTIRFAPKYEIDTFTIVDISSSGQVDFTATDTSPGAFRGSISGAGTVQTGDVRIEFAPADDGRVIVEVTPR